METADASKQYAFLKGGGEMGALTRNHDWNSSPLGTPDHWPQSLRTTVSIILNSRFPMFLFWGPDHLCFYNDAYRPSLGNDGKHPGALGQKGEVVWPEIWKDIKPLIDQALKAEEAVWREDQLLPIYRNGRLEDVYWTFSYSAVRDETGEPAGVFVTCTETTEKIKSLGQLSEHKDQLEFAIEAAELGTWDLNPATNKFTGNGRLKEWFGLRPEEEVDLSLAIGVIAEEDRERVADAIANTMQYESGGQYNIEYTIVHPMTKSRRIVAAKGRAWFNEQHLAYRLNGTLQDITVERNAQNEIKETQLMADLALRSAGIGLFQINLVNGKANYSPLYAQLMTGDADLKNADREVFTRHVHPEDRHLRDKILKVALEQGEFSYEPRVIWDDGSLHRLHVHGGTMYDKDRNPTILTGTVRDITAFEAQAHALRESESQLRSLIEKTPVATALFRGKELVIELANDVMLGYWQKGDIVGRRYREAVPELEGQGYFEMLEELLETGADYHTTGGRADILVNGVSETRYFNYSFTPLRNSDGEVYAILNMGIDVTDQIIARQKLEYAEEELRGAIELAGLATWSMDVRTSTFSYSPRFMDWLGFSEDTKQVDAAYDPLPGEYRSLVPAAIAAAIAPGSSGIYDFEHPIINRLTSQQRIIHAQARVYYDAAGHPLELKGTAQDITIQHKIQWALENQVTERTEALADANDAMQTVNEELAATNEELEEANRQLVHSNEDLAQYAYVASHDLQEPLRKIRMFSGMLGAKADFPEAHRGLIDKINQSSERMTLLIHDLLEFSRLLHTEHGFRPVDLNETATAIKVDFELVIQEKHAEIELGPMPVIEAVSIQMNQLFYNLIGNALKFIDRHTTPRIRIDAAPLAVEEVHQYLTKPNPDTTYYRITIADNGIGFDAQYAEQIFDVFKRLHGRDIYPGSGIGLALCRRIVANHHGFMYAESVAGAGARFHVILPDRQALAG